MQFIQQYRGDLAAIATGLCWSVAVILFKVAGQRFNSFSLNIFKNLVASILFAVSFFIFSDGPIIPNLTTNEWILLFGSAALGACLGDFLFILCLKKLGASLYAIVDCAYSPTVILIAFLMFNETIPVNAIIGGCIVIAAIIISSLDKFSFTGTRKDLIWGIILCILSQFVMVIAILSIRGLIRSESILWLHGFRFFIGFLLLTIWALVSNRRDLIKNAFTMGNGLRITFMATFIGSFFASFLWFIGFKYSLAGKAAIYNQLATIFIILLAITFLKERLTKLKIFSIILGISGALIVGWN